MVKTLQRPMVFVHGYSGWADQGKPLADFMVQNPENEYGGTFRTGEEDEFRQSVREHPESTVYTVALSNPRASFAETSAELTEALSIIKTETGLDPDLVVHSMGGLVTREHLHLGHQDIHDVFFLGTPNAGVPWNPLTDLSTRLASPLLGNAPQAMRADRLGFSSGHNEHLAELNRDWPNQLGKIHRAYTIAGTRIPTPSAEIPFVAKGDGVVAESSVKLEGATHVTVRQLDPFSFPLADNHLSMISNPKVLAFINDQVTAHE